MTSKFAPQFLTDFAASPQIITGAVALLVSILFFKLFSAYSIAKKLPPGPTGLPVIGQYLKVRDGPEFVFHDWYKKYGPLFSFWNGNQLYVIVSDPGIVKDLLVTNGAVFSSRKDIFIKSQTILKGRAITDAGYNETWRKHRRVAWSYLQQRSVAKFLPAIEQESVALVKTLMEDSKNGQIPSSPYKYAGRFMLNNMLNLTFGIRTNSVNDPLVTEILRISREFMNLTSPVANLVDFVPLLQWLPTSKRTRARQLHNDTVKLYGGIVNSIKAKLKAGEHVPDCFAKKLVEVQEKEQLDDLDLAILTGAFLIAGVEAPSGLIQWFAGAITSHPDVQLKAQEELDRVVGSDRLPDLSDHANLPYCRAIIKEVERFYNPFWLGNPHFSTEDFVYKGTLIPKDTILILGLYSMHFNETRYPEPFRFNPDRYLNDALTAQESANLSNPFERDHWMYGAGRRICLGIVLAEQELFLAITRMLWAFNLEELPDEPINLNKYEGLSGRSPTPFRMKLTPRNPSVIETLQNINVH